MKRSDSGRKEQKKPAGAGGTETDAEKREEKSGARQSRATLEGVRGGGGGGEVLRLGGSRGESGKPNNRPASTSGVG